MRLIARPLTTIGDAAILHIRATMSEYQTTRPPLWTIGRISRSSTALGTCEIMNTRRQAYFLRVVTVLDAYIGAAHDLMLRQSIPPAAEVANSLLNAHLITASLRWESRIESFREHLGLSFGDAAKGFPSWARLKGMIEVRNSIAHGLGGLTRIQRKNPIRTAGRCSQAGVRIEAGELIVSEASLKAAVVVAEDFVEWLDDRL